MAHPYHPTMLFGGDEHHLAIVGDISKITNSLETAMRFLNLAGIPHKEVGRTDYRKLSWHIQASDPARLAYLAFVDDLDGLYFERLLRRDGTQVESDLAPFSSVVGFFYEPGDSDHHPSGDGARGVHLW